MRAGKRRAKKRRPSQRLDDRSQLVAQGDRCVFCGKSLAFGDPPFLAQAHTRSFPVCSEGCRAGTEHYVRQDKKLKKFFYLLLFFCAVIILIAAVMGSQQLLIDLAILAGGAGFLFFPYPISSFETFLSCPIRTVVRVCRVVGVLLLTLGLFFLYMTFYTG